MSTNETSLEDKIFGLAVLIMCLCIGYWFRSKDMLALFLHDLGVPLAFVIADGLVTIIMFGSIFLVLGLLILYHLDKKETEEQ